MSFKISDGYPSHQKGNQKSTAPAVGKTGIIQGVPAFTSWAPNTYKELYIDYLEETPSKQQGVPKGASNVFFQFTGGQIDYTLANPGQDGSLQLIYLKDDDFNIVGSVTLPLQATSINLTNYTVFSTVGNTFYDWTKFAVGIDSNSTITSMTTPITGYIRYIQY